MNDNRLYMFIWGVIATMVATISVALVLESMHSTDKIAEMVSNGASPIAAACAVYDYSGNNPTCTLLAAKELKEN